MCGICFAVSITQPAPGTHRVIPSIPRAAEHDSLNDISSNSNLVVDLDMDGRKSHCSRPIRAFSLEEADPSVRDRDRQLALIALSERGPRLALDLLMTLELNRRLARGKRLEGC
jgi:hypothetical protein